MSEKPAGPEESSVPLFDVVVKIPSGTSLQDIERLARDVAEIPSDRVDKLMAALRNTPQAKIGAAVTKERADKAREQFGKAGLTVEVTPLLSVAAMVTGSFDGLFSCPSCKQRVALPENRQCPNCGVFVDKVSDEALLRRKIMEQERNKLDFQSSKDAKEADKSARDALEARLRAEVRAELEKRYGIKGNSRSGKIVKGVAVLALLGVAFVGGKGFGPGGWSWDRATTAATGGGASEAKVAEKGDVDKMLDSVGPMGPGGAAGAAGAGQDPVAGAVGDPDIDDELMQSFGGKKVGGKGLTIEQAVAASKTLAKSVGNTTAERAAAGGGAAGAAAAGAAAQGGTGAAAAATAGAAAADTGGAGGTASAGSTGSAIPPRTRAVLSLEMARQLAEMKQLPRALGMMKAIQANPAVTGDPATAVAARVTDLEIRAWAVGALAGADARKALDGLMSGANGLPDAASQVQALSRVGAILSRHEQLPPDASRAFLTRAGEALKSVSDAGQRNVLTGDWAVALGEVVLAEATLRARAGAWSKVQAAASQLDTLIRQAPDASSQARLHAIGYQLNEQMGQHEKATQSMTAGLALAAKVASVPERAALLRSMAALSIGAANDKLQAAVAAVQAQAMSRPPLERAQALAQLALLNADAGLRAKAGELSQLAQSTTGLAPADAAVLQADLTARSDLASARVLHGVGLYAESEAILQRVAGFLS